MRGGGGGGGGLRKKIGDARRLELYLHTKRYNLKQHRLDYQLQLLFKKGVCAGRPDWKDPAEIEYKNKNRRVSSIIISLSAPLEIL